MTPELFESIIKSYKDRIMTFRGYCKEYKRNANLKNYEIWAKKQN